MKHWFVVEESVNYGLHKSIILNQLRYHIGKNKEAQSCFFDGHYWFFRPRKAFWKFFPYIDYQVFCSHLSQLEGSGIIISSNNEFFTIPSEF